MLDSKFADINNVGSGGFAGSITAALFLRKFVSHARTYLHFDIFGWVPSGKPGRPEGGEPQAARLVAELLLARFGLSHTLS
jgi:leucyl aminopeptidase